MANMSTLTPTFRGLIKTKADILMLVEACLQGRLPHTPRKPYPEESRSLVEVGNTFVYEKNASGFQDWNDPLPWSSPDKDDDIEIFMCESPNLRKLTAQVVWQNTTHFLVSYQPATSSITTGLENLSQVTDLGNLNPREGMFIQGGR